MNVLEVLWSISISTQILIKPDTTSLKRSFKSHFSGPTPLLSTKKDSLFFSSNRSVAVYPDTLLVFTDILTDTPCNFKKRNNVLVK